MNNPQGASTATRIGVSIVAAYAFVSFLYITQDLLLPLIYGVLISIALSPIVNFFVRKKIHRTIAVSMVMVFTLAILAFIITLLLSQTSRLTDAGPLLILKFQGLLSNAVLWVSLHADVRTDQINLWIQEALEEVVKHQNDIIGTTLSAIGGAVSTALLTPVYVFMILIYQEHILTFIRQLFSSQEDQRVNEFLTETKSMVKNYLSGLFLQIGVIAVLNSIGLLILGIDYAILLGTMGAFLNVIPYLGGLIAVASFMVIALLTKTPLHMLYVAMLYSGIQFIDNNYLVPKIIGSKVQLNALISVIAVVIGAALWGIPGMFLFIPLTAILKLLFDRVESLKPWGYLLGEGKGSAILPKIKFKIIGFQSKTKNK